MSVDRSLKSGDILARHRNVLTRDERLAILTEEDKWTEEEGSVFGLPKVLHRKSHAGRKAKKEAPTEDDAASEAPAAT